MVIWGLSAGEVCCPELTGGLQSTGLQGTVLFFLMFSRVFKFFPNEHAFENHLKSTFLTDKI